MLTSTLYRQFRRVGRSLYMTGLVSSHGGNLSVRLGYRLVIKRRGGMLGYLDPSDLIEAGLEGENPLASTELIVHQAIYRATNALAVVHAHPRTAVALSFDRDTITPLDTEGRYVLNRVPEVAVDRPSGSPEVARAVASALQSHPVVVVRSHGSFAVGGTLEEALQRTSVLEESCEIIWKLALLNR